MTILTSILTSISASAVLYDQVLWKVIEVSKFLKSCMETFTSKIRRVNVANKHMGVYLTRVEFSSSLDRFQSFCGLSGRTANEGQPGGVGIRGTRLRTESWH